MLDQIKKWLGLDDSADQANAMPASAPAANDMSAKQSMVEEAMENTEDMMEDVREEVEEMAASVSGEEVESDAGTEQVVCEECGKEGCECDANGECNCGEGCGCGHTDMEEAIGEPMAEETSMIDETPAEDSMPMESKTEATM